MAKKSIRVNTKRRGRPKTTGRGTLVGVRLHEPLLSALDRFIAEEKRDLSRPEAIREALKDWMIGQGLLKPG